MTIDEFRYAMTHGCANGADELNRTIRELTQEALKLVAELNGSYHVPTEVRDLLSRLTGSNIDDSVVLLPPFYTDCGKNLHIGKRVFINEGCHFQDHGGVVIGDDVFIGPQTIITTLNHDMDAEHRSSLFPRPVHVGNRVWLGARVTICPGVTIGEGSIVAAGAVVTKNVPPETIVAGVPARVVRYLRKQP